MSLSLKAGRGTWPISETGKQEKPLASVFVAGRTHRLLPSSPVWIFGVYRKGVHSFSTSLGKQRDRVLTGDYCHRTFHLPILPVPFVCSNCAGKDKFPLTEELKLKL